MRIVLLDIDKPKPGKYQFYLDWFKEAWTNAGGKIQTKIEFPYEFKLVVAKLKIGRKTSFTNKKKVLLVIGGAYIDFNAFPYNYFYEIVPVFWDTWKKYHPLLISGLIKNKVKYAFFTQKEVAEYVKNNVPGIKTFWMPEGIKINAYNKGPELKERKITILQFGRKMEDYHQVILKTIDLPHKYAYSTNDGEKLFKNFEDLSNGISNAAISICFPRSMTHPELTGGIETLTQRYWESLLSGCLIVGKAPKELIELMGYNPVIEVDWDNPSGQLGLILKSIDNYQEFVDLNHRKALEICSWEKRIIETMTTLKKIGYTV